jgi:hypothetical protein
MKTVRINVYTPWGTTSARHIEGAWGRHLLHSMTVPKCDAESQVDRLKLRYKELGFTHYRFNGSRQLPL